jgi:hypothetical protein
MSQNFGETGAGGGGLQYEQQIQAPLPSPMSETPVQHVSNEEAALGRAPVKDLSLAPQPFRSTVAIPEGTPTVAELLNTDGDDPITNEPVGRGPRLVVLHEHVKGGKTRGEVIWLSDILGLQAFFDAEQTTDTSKQAKAQVFIRKELARLVRLKAVRQALPEEASYTKVTFIEGEQKLTSELTKTQEALAAERAKSASHLSELEQLRQRVLELQTQGQFTPPPPGEENPEGGAEVPPTPPSPPASGPPQVPVPPGTTGTGGGGSNMPQM